MLEQAYKFRLDGKPIFCGPYGSGHINDTYLLVDSTARQYILQKVNKNVFHDIKAVMENVLAVTQHLRGMAASSREVLRLFPTKDGDNWLVDEEGEYWRVYAFISDSVCFDKTESVFVFRESGLAFGMFQRWLSDFPAKTLNVTIPRFHDTPSRYAALHQAIKADALGRVKSALPEIEFALKREEYGFMLANLQEAGDLPLRVVHNDSKLNNILFDRDTHKYLCVIDLDTVMPGYSVNDFGDSIRFGASTALEDERDLSKVSLSMPLFEAYADGYITACRTNITKQEGDCLCDGAKTMTLECGIRFLTDYLSGDTYFRIHREGQNLDRCRTQLKLVSDMENNWDTMRRTIKNILQ